MKKAILIFLLLGNITPAYADEGGWVKVSTDGKVISGTSVCTPDVCGDGNSEFAKLTLLPGERYVQITKADSTGNVVGPNVLASEKMLGQFNPISDTVTFISPGKMNLGFNNVLETEGKTVYKVGEGQIESTITVVGGELNSNYLMYFQEWFFDLFSNWIWAWQL
jgi:hypothetical protein